MYKTWRGYRATNAKKRIVFFDDCTSFLVGYFERKNIHLDGCIDKDIGLITFHLCLRTVQLDGNSFAGVVVLHSFNKAFQDEDNILDLKYKGKILYKVYNKKSKKKSVN